MTLTRLRSGIPLRVLSLAAVISCVRLPAQAAEAAGCCGTDAQPAPESAAGAGAKQSTADGPTVCPKYKWMTYANYCSFYSLAHPTCQPINYDGDCATATNGDCTDNNPPCITTIVHRTDDPGDKGYGHPDKPKESKWTGAGFPGGMGSGVGITPIEKFVVKFKGKGTGSEDIYAQVFIGLLWEGATPIGVVARGHEIQPVALNTALGDHDYTASDAVQPIKGRGRPHAYEYNHGSVRVEIIVHYTTSGHPH